MLKKIFSHSLIYGLAPQLPKIASIFILPLITKDLTTKDYGIAGIIEAYTGALSAVGGLGLSVVLSNYYFKVPSHFKKYWKEIHGLLSLWSIAFAILLALYLYLIIPPEAEKDLYLLIILICVPPLLFNTTNTIGQFYYQLQQKPLIIGVISAISGFVAVFMNLYTISYLKLGYLGWFISSSASYLVSFLFYLYPLYFVHKLGPFFNFKLRRIKRYLRISLPTIPHFYSSYLLDSADRVIMDFNKLSLSNLGLYNVGYNFGNYVRFMVMAINQAVSPLYLNLYSINTEDAKNKARNLTFLLQSGVLLLCSLLALWLKEVFELLIKNSELKMGYSVGILIIMAYSYRPMYVGSVNKLFYYEQTDQLWKISFVAGAINVVLNIIFIPIYGIYAAAFTTLLSMLYLGFSTFFLKVYKDIIDKTYYPLRWMTLILLMTLLVYIFKDFGLLFKGVISVAFIGGFFMPILKFYKGLSI